MNKLTKQTQEQNYLVLPAVFLKLWFEKMHQEQFGALVAHPKALPLAKTEKNLDIKFSDWDMPTKTKDMLIEEYLWGIRCGVIQHIDVDRCSFSDVLEVAKTDQMCEIYSPAKVQYFSDGSRKVIPQNISVYNTDAKFGCWSLINLKQAKNLFPQYVKVFDELPKETKFLCSPEIDKLRIANQENGEIGFNFNAVDTPIKNIGFYLGHLRPSFQYIAREIGAGGGSAFCDSEQLNNLDYLQSKICLMSGGEYPYSLAANLVSESSYPQMRSAYLKEGIKGKESFRILIDGSYLHDDKNINRFVENDGSNIKICVPPSVYQSQYDKNISWSGDEQFEVVKGNIRLIFGLKNVFLKTEALLLEPENESVLLEYASTRRFFYHDNEMRFLLMGQKYPTEVEKYLTKYGKNISLTDDEEFNVVERNKNALQHIKVQSLMVYRDYVLPKKRKKNIPFSEEDLPMLIRLSYDNPLLLEEFVIEHGKLSPEYEAELFFKAEEKCRKKYIELYGVNLRTLVKNAVQYGATENEQQMLKQSNFAKEPTYFTLLNKWNMFNKEVIKKMRLCQLSDAARVRRGCSYIRCENCLALELSLLTKFSILLYIARRNNLLGVG